jgi:hypothetical protein
MYFSRGFFGYFPHVRVYIFGPMTLISIQMLFISGKIMMNTLINIPNSCLRRNLYKGAVY